MANILVIDDEKRILSVVKTALSNEHRVEGYLSYEDVPEQAFSETDLVILDVMMPKEDGFSICAMIRPKVECPIIFLTARCMEEDVAYGFSLGADDYIKKPFSIVELRARVNAHLRREHRHHSQTLSLGKLNIDLSARKVSYAGQDIELTKSEYDIVHLLVRYPGQVFSKEQIYECIYGYDKDGNESAITEHVKNIRKRLKLAGCDAIETVWGIGYRWKKQ